MAAPPSTGTSAEMVELGNTRSLESHLKSRIKASISRWNKSRGPAGWKSISLWVSIAATALWVWITGVYTFDSFPQLLPWPIEWLRDRNSGWGDAFVASFLWTATVGGSAATYALVEFNRNVFSSRALLPFVGSGSLRGKPQRRMTPRIEPVISGLVERLLLTVIAIQLIRVDQLGAAGAIFVAYVVLKSIKRMQAQQVAINVSIHSIWGSGVSVGFAVLAGWMFNHVLTS